MELPKAPFGEARRACSQALEAVEITVTAPDGVCGEKHLRLRFAAQNALLQINRRTRGHCHIEVKKGAESRETLTASCDVFQRLSVLGTDLLCIQVPRGTFLPRILQLIDVAGRRLVCTLASSLVIFGGMKLVWPADDYLASYVQALRRGWSPNNLRPEEAQRELLRIVEDAEGFLASRVDREARGGPITLGDGSLAQRLPSLIRWMWDGEFCGLLGLRWQPGTAALPPYVLGHIGYTVVPWKRGRGYATEGLRQFLSDARAENLPYVELTTDPDNIASQKVITKNGGVLVERFTKTAAFGGGPGLRWRINL